MTKLIIKNGRIVYPRSIIENCIVEIEEGLISNVNPKWNGLTGTEDIIDATGCYVAPGLIDIQVNGYNSVSFSLENAEDTAKGNDDLTIEDVKEVTKGLWKEGVTTYFPTLTTNSRELLIKNFKTLYMASSDESNLGSIAGFHLEGPYISAVDGFRGAHPLAYVRQPDINEFAALYKASGEKIKLITVAPETDGALDFIAECLKMGLVVSLGHHNGSSLQISKATKAGAILSTHLGNGCPQNIDRHNNHLWPQLANDSLKICLIADGFHLPPDMLKVFYKVKGVENIILTSDITSYAGMPAGVYTIKGGETIEKTNNNKLSFSGTNGGLYGSATTLQDGVAHFMQVTGCGLHEAIQMATKNPAKIHGLTDRGIIETGKRADLILFTIEDAKIVIQKTIVAGKIVYTKDENSKVNKI
jgi:N-acetylglucosamine-6-phosphate deacetylase